MRFRRINEERRLKMHYILLVEDNKDNADMIIHILASAGYEVRHFSTGLAAAQEARREKPELILMDFNLPDVDGRTLSLVLTKQLGGASSPPIIACTARVGTAEAKLAEQFGCAAFLRKPFSPEDLLALVERFVPHAAGS
jgi:two-component system cell cycle response regulator DivK